jgi:hypothetical protein
MALLEKWSKLAAVAIAQDDGRSNQVRAGIGAPGLRAVARDAFSGPDVPPAIRRCGIDDGTILWTDTGPRILRTRENVRV